MASESNPDYETREVILEIKVEPPVYGKFCHVNGSIGVRVKNCETLETRKAWSVFESATPFHRVQIEKQGDKDSLRDSHFPFYSRQITWNGDSTLENMEEGVKALRKVHAFLDKAAEETENPQTIGVWYARIMKAMEVKYAELVRPGEETATVHVGSIAWEIDAIVHAWRTRAITAYHVYREHKSMPGGRSYLDLSFNTFRREMRADYGLRGFAHVFLSLEAANDAARDFGGKVEATEITIKDETRRFMPVS